MTRAVRRFSLEDFAFGSAAGCFVKRVLFWFRTGHGEAAIADCIAAELSARLCRMQALDHLALVGEPDLGLRCEKSVPQRTMPSGGLIAMGNVGNLLRDLRSRSVAARSVARGGSCGASVDSYDVAVAVGDVYALAMTLHARSSTVFVGTAKSVSVARYGALEERSTRAPRKARFVRDKATAQALREARLVRRAQRQRDRRPLCAGRRPGRRSCGTTGFATMLVLFPGSRASAYDDAGSC